MPGPHQYAPRTYDSSTKVTKLKDKTFDIRTCAAESLGQECVRHRQQSRVTEGHEGIRRPEGMSGEGREGSALPNNGASPEGAAPLNEFSI